MSDEMLIWRGEVMLIETRHKKSAETGVVFCKAAINGLRLIRLLLFQK